MAAPQRPYFGGPLPAEGCGRTLPSGNLIETNSAPGSPLNSGLAIIVASSPFLIEVRFQPVRTKYAGAVISIFQVTTLPSLPGTSISIEECGFSQRNS